MLRELWRFSIAFLKSEKFSSISISYISNRTGIITSNTSYFIQSIEIFLAEIKPSWSLSSSAKMYANLLWWICWTMAVEFSLILGIASSIGYSFFILLISYRWSCTASTFFWSRVLEDILFELGSILGLKYLSPFRSYVSFFFFYWSIVWSFWFFFF